MAKKLKTSSNLREKLFAKLFACTFCQENLDTCLKKNSSQTFFGKLLRQLDQLDQLIANVATERPLSDINKVDLAIIRLIVFEWKEKKTPPKVLINEGVELAKNFGTENSYRFVNGVLGKIMMDES